MPSENKKSTCETIIKNENKSMIQHVNTDHSHTKIQKYDTISIETKMSSGDKKLDYETKSKDEIKLIVQNMNEDDSYATNKCWKQLMTKIKDLIKEEEKILNSEEKEKKTDMSEKKELNIREHIANIQKELRDIENLASEYYKCKQCLEEGFIINLDKKTAELFCNKRELLCWKLLAEKYATFWHSKKFDPKTMMSNTWKKEQMEMRYLIAQLELQLIYSRDQRTILNAKERDENIKWMNAMFFTQDFKIARLEQELNFAKGSIKNSNQILLQTQSDVHCKKKATLLLQYEQEINMLQHHVWNLENIIIEHCKKDQNVNYFMDEKMAAKMENVDINLSKVNEVVNKYSPNKKDQQDIADINSISNQIPVMFHNIETTNITVLKEMAKNLKDYIRENKVDDLVVDELQKQNDILIAKLEGDHNNKSGNDTSIKSCNSKNENTFSNLSISKSNECNVSEKMKESVLNLDSIIFGKGIEIALYKNKIQNLQNRIHNTVSENLELQQISHNLKEKDSIILNLTDDINHLVSKIEMLKTALLQCIKLSSTREKLLEQMHKEKEIHIKKFKELSIERNGMEKVIKKYWQEAKILQKITKNIINLSLVTLPKKVELQDIISDISSGKYCTDCSTNKSELQKYKRDCVNLINKIYDLKHHHIKSLIYYRLTERDMLQKFNFESISKMEWENEIKNDIENLEKKLENMNQLFMYHKKEDDLLPSILSESYLFSANQNNNNNSDIANDLTISVNPTLREEKEGLTY